MLPWPTNGSHSALLTGADVSVNGGLTTDFVNQLTRYCRSMANATGGARTRDGDGVFLGSGGGATRVDP
ncbi:MAG: hypothetical protein R3F49_22300 [Planctomycetota bacterium]